MLMRRSVALDNLSKTIPPIDSDQKVALLHAPFKGTTFFGGKLAKLHRANKEPASSVFILQLTLSLTPLSLTQVVVDLSGKVAPPTGRVAEIEISAKYCRKRRLCIQNRSAGCVLPTFCLRQQGISVPSTSLRSEHCPSGIYSPGPHRGTLPPSSGDIGYTTQTVKCYYATSVSYYTH